MEGGLSYLFDENLCVVSCRAAKNIVKFSKAWSNGAGTYSVSIRRLTTLAHGRL